MLVYVLLYKRGIVHNHQQNCGFQCIQAALTLIPSIGKVRALVSDQQIQLHLAEVAELVDALASGASELWLVEVQVLFSAPHFIQ